MAQSSKLKQIFQWIIFLGVCFLLIHFYLPAHSKYDELSRKEKALDAKIHQLEKEITRMREEKQLLENDVMYLEKVVRENMGRVEPGETVYKIVNVPDPTPGYELQESNTPQEEDSS